MSVAFDTQKIETAEPVLNGDEMYRLGLQASIGNIEAPLDLIDAHKWFNLAAMQGNAEARHYRAELAAEMTSDEIAEAQRRARQYLADHRPKRAN